MRISILLHFFLACCISGTAWSTAMDSTVKPKIRYTKKQWQKESKDLKSFDAQIKVWNKAVKERNPDFQNEVFKRLLTTADKEYQELSTRISERSKQLVPPSPHPLGGDQPSDDQPRVYNPELKDQHVHVKKEDILSMKAESDFLSQYIAIIKKQKITLDQLNQHPSFDAQTKPEMFSAIAAQLQGFRSGMKSELDLMKKETAKK
ncbi:MAG TPA: hypothetical protein VFX48_02795 [Saprospiraceae bacterium]|nr:hypothetical protein [Saprospiraceae bacterium]